MSYQMYFQLFVYNIFLLDSIRLSGKVRQPNKIHGNASHRSSRHSDNPDRHLIVLNSLVNSSPDLQLHESSTVNDGLGTNHAVMLSLQHRIITIHTQKKQKHHLTTEPMPFLPCKVVHFQWTIG